MRERHYTGFWRQGAIVQMCMLVLGAFILTGCNDSNIPTQSGAVTTPVATPGDELSVSKLLGSLTERVQGASGGVQQALAPHGDVIQERTKEEVEKLFRWEYRVVELEAPLSAPDFEKRLSELGNEGWECFYIATTDTATRVTCKRRPRSALAYLKFIPGF